MLFGALLKTCDDLPKALFVADDGPVLLVPKPLLADVAALPKMFDVVCPNPV